MSDLDEELLREFKVESQEHLAAVEPALLEVEDADAERQNELLHLIFRAVHSVKGASGFFDLDTIQQLSHTMESLLMRVRDGEIPYVAEMTDALLVGLDALGQMIDHLPETVDLEVKEIEVRLETLTSNQPVDEAKPDASNSSGEVVDESQGTIDTATTSPTMSDVLAETDAPASIADGEPVNLVPADYFEEARRFGRHVFRIERDTFESLEEEDPDRLDGVATKLGETSDATGRFVVVSSVLDLDLLAGALAIPGARLSEIGPADAQSDPDAVEDESRSTGAAETASILEPANLPSDSDASCVAAKPSASTKDKVAGVRRSESAETVRVSVHLLDRLMDQAGELVLSRNQLLRHFAETPDANVKGILQDIDLITSELQGDIMNTRMQPIGGVFNKFTRIVRDLSRKLGKDVDLVIEGSEVELDKSIVELLSDPLTHLVRNALDHGVETPEERAAAQKPQTGEIALRAFHEGGQVHIEIEDDGSGIDPDRMRSVAVSKELMSAAEAARLSDSDARMLIFAPGFSTAAEVSDVSGRGVGMDVVKTNIGKLGGKVEIDSEIGCGTRLTIALPLTLAIIPSLVVEIQGDRLAIPQVNLVELVRVKNTELDKHVSKVSDAPVLRLRGNLLPLISLSDLLDIDPSTERTDEPPSPEERPEDDEDSDALHVVVLQVGGNSFGLTVDRVLDSEEIVVKPLSSMLEGIPLYSGATIMGDGRVAMILDAHGIAEMSALRLEEQKASEATELGTEAPGVAKRSLVLFNNASDEQFAIDLKSLIRLERVLPEQLERVGDDTCIQYLGEGLPIVRLEEQLPVRPIPEDRDELYVLIPKVEGRPIGVLAGEIVDAVDVEIRLDETAGESTAIEGRALIGDRLTLLLNPDQLSNLTSQGDPA